jgi:hypothetical protein
MGGSKVVESGVDGRLLELETKYASLRRAYLALDADLEELIEKGYRKMHRYRMEESRELEKAEADKKRPVEKRLIESYLAKAAALSSDSRSSDTAATEQE